MTGNDGIPLKSPYGRAMRFIDKVISVDATRSTITANYAYSSTSEMIEDHSLAAGSVVPGIFLIEQAAQTALAFVLLKNPDKATNLVRLVNIRAEWLSPAPLDCPITATVSLKPAGAETSSFSAKLSVDDTVVARVRGLVSFAVSRDA